MIKAFSLSLCFGFKINKPNLISQVSQGKIQGIIELSYDKTGNATDDYFLCFKDYMEAFQKLVTLLEFCKREKSVLSSRFTSHLLSAS